MGKTVEVVAGDGFKAALAFARKRAKGFTMPHLRDAVGCGSSTADNYITRMVTLGLVSKRQGTAEDLETAAGRPPNVYTWKGAEVRVVPLADFWHSQKSEATLAREKRKAKAAKPKAKAAPKAKAPAGRKALTAEQRAAKAAKDKARRAAAKAETQAAA